MTGVDRRCSARSPSQHGSGSSAAPPPPPPESPVPRPADAMKRRRRRARCWPTQVVEVVARDRVGRAFRRRVDRRSGRVAASAGQATSSPARSGTRRAHAALSTVHRVMRRRPQHLVARVVVGAHEAGRLDGDDLAVGRGDLAERADRATRCRSSGSAGRRRSGTRCAWASAWRPKPCASHGSPQSPRRASDGANACWTSGSSPPRTARNVGRLVAGGGARGVPGRSHQGPQVAPEVVEQRVEADGVVRLRSTSRVSDGLNQSRQSEGSDGSSIRVSSPASHAALPSVIHAGIRRASGSLSMMRVLVAVHGLVGQEHVQSVGHAAVHDLLALPARSGRPRSCTASSGP